MLAAVAESPAAAATWPPPPLAPSSSIAPFRSHNSNLPTLYHYFTSSLHCSPFSTPATMSQDALQPHLDRLHIPHTAVQLQAVIAIFDTLAKAPSTPPATRDAAIAACLASPSLVRAQHPPPVSNCCSAARLTAAGRPPAPHTPGSAVPLSASPWAGLAGGSLTPGQGVAPSPHATLAQRRRRESVRKKARRRVFFFRLLSPGPEGARPRPTLSPPPLARLVAGIQSSHQTRRPGGWAAQLRLGGRRIGARAAPSEKSPPLARTSLVLSAPSPPPPAPSHSSSLLPLSLSLPAPTPPQ